MRRSTVAVRRVVALVEWMAVAGIVLAAFSCSGSGIAPDAGGPPGNTGFGSLPNDLGPARNVATLTVTTINGNDTFARSDVAHVTDLGTGVQISVTDGIQWAMYKFSPGGNPLTRLKITLNEIQGNFHTWVAVSDYGHGHWAWYGPYHSVQPDIDLTIPAGAVWTDAANNMYFAVVAWNGALVEVLQSEVTVDVPAAAATYTEDTKAVFDDNCISCHVPPAAPMGVVLDNYTDAAANASAAAAKVADGSHPPAGMPTAYRDLLQAWSDGGALLGPATRYSTDVGPSIFSAHCIGCHPGYGTYAGAKPDAKKCNTRIQAGTMPPAGALSAALKTMMQDWIDDGWPN